MSTFFGKIWTGCWGPTAYQFASIRGERVGQVITITAEVLPEYRERYYYLCLNGIYINSYFADASGILKMTVPPAFGNSVDSIYLEDGGLNGSPDEDTSKLVVHAAQMQARADATRIHTTWNCSGQYETSDILGTSQLSSVVITGAVRGENCELNSIMPSRGRLGITIENSGTTRTVRFYNGNTLVSEGSRSGDGSITCSPIDSTGITVTASITYTAKVELGEAYVELQWPAGWYLHVSTSALSYPRTAEYFIENFGSDEYSHLTAPLAAGTYNVDIIAIDDEGDSSSPLTVSGSPFLIKSTPSAPTITSVTETAPNTYSVAFTNSDVLATSHTCYFSCVNDAINGIDPLGSLLSAGPTPVTGSSPISITIPAYTTQDYTADFSTLETAIDTAAAALISAYGSGETGFLSTVTTQTEAVIDAVQAYATATNQQFRTAIDQLTIQNDQVLQQATSLDGQGYDSDEWDAYMAPSLSYYLQYLGLLLDNTPSRYVLPNYGIPGDYYAGLPNIKSLFDSTSPLIRPNKVSIIVRAKNASNYEEKNGNVWELFLDGSGSEEDAKPNDPIIRDIDLETPSQPSAIMGNIGSNTGTGTTLSWSHTIASNDNRCLFIWVAAVGGSLDITGVTVDSSPASLIDTITAYSGYVIAKVYHYISPSVGSVTIDATLTASSGIESVGRSVDFYNVDQSSPVYSEEDEVIGYSTSITDVSPPTTDGTVLLGATLGSHNASYTATLNPDLTALGSEEEMWDIGIYSTFNAFYRSPAGSADTTVSFSDTIQDLAMHTFLVNPIAATGIDVAVDATYIQDDQYSDADYLDYYVEQSSGSYSFGSPDVSVELTEVTDDVVQAGQTSVTGTINVSTTGWHKVAVKARDSGTGQRSDGYAEKYFHISTASPAQPNGAAGNVQGGRGQ